MKHEKLPDVPTDTRRRLPILTAYALVGACMMIAAHAAPSDPDPVFTANAGGVYGTSDFGNVSSVFVQPDGKILVGSNEMGTSLGAGLKAPLLRFNADGTVDNTFFADTDPNGDGLGIVFIGSGWPEVMALGLQSDGKIIAGGVMTGMNDGTTNLSTARSLVRINPDGTADGTFQNTGVTPTATGSLNYVEDLTVEPNDKILLTGGFGGVRDLAFTTTTRYGIARLNADGSLDSTFQLDPTQFGVPAGATQVRGIFYQAARDASGNYYIAGELSWFGGAVNVLGRLFPNGQRDTSFAPSGLPNALWTGVAITADGKLTALGQVTSQPSVMVRLNPDGSPDGSFALAAGLGTFSARPLQLDSAGRCLVFGFPGTGLKRLDANGGVDPTFDATAAWVSGPHTTAYWNAHTAAPSGKIYAGGFFNDVEGTGSVKIAAFEGDPVAQSFSWRFAAPSVAENAGSLTVEVIREGSASGAASVDFATANGSAIAGTDYTSTSGTLNWASGEGGSKFISIPISNNPTADGSRTFAVTLSNPSGGVISGASAITATILDDEAAPVIVTQPSSIAVKEGFAGSLSVSVSSPVPPAFQWYKGGVLMPGKTSSTLSFTAVAAGDAANYTVTVSTGGTPLTSDPATLTVIPPATALDPAYNPSGIESTAPVVFLTDGSLLAVNGDSTSGFSLLKFDAAGTLAATWLVTITGSGPLAINPLPTGKFLVSGNFTVINGVARNRLARLNADGTVDESFNAALEAPGSGSFSGPVVTSTGKVFISWRPASGSGGLLRLLDNGSADPAFSSTLTAGTSGYLWSLAELPDGSLLAGYTAGDMFGLTRGLAKLTSAGAPFPGFTALTSLFPEPRFILPLADGRFVVARNTILEIRKADGAVDPSFTLAGSFTGNITAAALQRGRIVIAGPSAFNGQSIPGLARFSLTGQWDDNFPAGTGPNTGVVSSFGIDSQERILVRGIFTSWNGSGRNRLARLTLTQDEVAFETPAATGHEDGGPFTISLVRYGNAASSASVRVTSTGGSATSPADFAAVDQTVNWGAGDSAPKEITITPVNNALLDGTRSFTLALSEGANVFPVAGAMTVSIRDDESLPQITAQPQEVLAVSGTAASFSVTATSPTALSYQWFLGGNPISGATSATYNIASVSPANEGSYTVRVTNAYDSVFSAAASLVIIPPPAAIASGFTPPAANIFNNNILALATAPDGGVYAGGAFTSIGGDVNRSRLAKINSDGSLDTSFIPPVFGNGEVRTLALQADGKVLVGGTFTSIASVTRNRLIRLNTNGTLDTDFSTAIGTAANGNVNSIVVEPDGNILVAGSITTWNGNSTLNSGIVRLSPAGALLGTGNVSTTVEVQDILRLPDGQVLISYNTTSSSAVKVRRLGSNLAHDTTFVYASGRTRAENMVLAADGDYLFAGNGGLFKVSTNAATVTQWSNNQHYDVVTQFNGKVLGGRLNNLPRYLADGTADPSFVVSIQPDSIVNRFARRDDGKIWVGGLFTNYSGTAVNKLFLLNADAVPFAITRQPQALTLADPGTDAEISIRATGISAISYQWFKDGNPVPGATSDTLLLEDVTIADNGDYTCHASNAQGSATSAVGQLIVLDAPVINGISDPVTLVEGGNFSLTVEAIGAPVLSYEWRRGGTLLANGPGITGADTATISFTNAPVSASGNYTVTVINSIDSATSAAVAVTVLENAAKIAAGFTAPTIGGTVRQVFPLPDGRVLIGGDFTSASDGVNTSGARLAVVNANGSVSPVAGLSADNSVYAIRDGGGGKILLAGAFNTINGQTRRRVARLDADFSLDTGFEAAGFTEFAGVAYDVARESAGTILVAGTFTDFNGDTAADYAVRLSDLGAHDTSFVSGSNNVIHRVLPQDGGKAVFLGSFNLWSGVAAPFAARSLASGAVDSGATFQTSGSFGFTDGFDLGSGIVIAAGGFTTAMKFDSTGVRDTAFLSAGNAITTAHAKDAAGRLLLGGNFTSIAGAALNRLARLNANGSRDDFFVIGTGFNAQVEDINVAGDGSIWCAGSFTSYNGTAVQRLVRLNGNPVTATDPVEEYLANAGVPEGLRGDLDDADFDGLANLIEYLYQTGPNDSASRVNPFTGSAAQTGAALAAGGVSGLDSGKTYRVIQVVVPKNLRGTGVAVQAGLNLSDFGTGSASATEFGTPVDNGDTETRSFYLTPATEDAPTLFWRFAVSR